MAFLDPPKHHSFLRLRRVPTLDDFFASFVENLRERDRRSNTIKNHIYLYSNFVRPVAGHLRIEDLTLAIGDVIAAAGRATAESNASRSVVTFRQLLQYIVRRGHRLPFDWRDVLIPRYRVRKRVEAYSAREIKVIRKFLSAQHIRLSKHTSETAKWQHAISLARMRAVFELNIHSGLRLSECPPLNIRDLDWETCQIRMRNSKTNEAEIVYFNGAKRVLRLYLSMRRDDNEALFVTHDGRRISREGLKSHFRIVRDLIRRDLKDFRKTYASHTLRKTYGTHLVLFGRADIKTAQRLMRHKSIRTTTNFYVALDEDLAAKTHRRVFSSF